MLADRGLARHIALYVSHFLVALLVIADTDLIATLPERTARMLADELKLKLELLEPPVPLSGFEIVHLWHNRTHDSAPHWWLRETIAAAASELGPGARA